MQAKVPLDIGIEDQILGPLSMRQLIILLGGGGICYLAFQNLDNYTWPFVVIPTSTLTLAFALIKINEMSFSQFLIAGLLYLAKPNQRIWKQLDDWVDSTDAEAEESAIEKVKRMQRETTMKSKINTYHAVGELTTLLDREGFVNPNLLENTEGIEQIDDDKFFSQIYRSEDYDFNQHFNRVNELISKKTEEVKKQKKAEELEEQPDINTPTSNNIESMLENIQHKFANVTIDKIAQDAKQDLEQTFGFKNKKSLKHEENPHLQK